MAGGQSRLQWFGWLRAILSSWVSVKISPSAQVFQELNVNPNQPICYILRSNSIFDFLTLDIYCTKLGLPRPQSTIDELGANKDAACVYLGNVGLLRTYGAYRHAPPSPFFKLLRRISAEPSFDVQMVPVSIFWGRDPGNAGKSVFKLFFPDDERASFVHKMLILIAHGRNGLLSFSKPIDLRSEFKSTENIDQTARKLTRVVRVHFQNKRVAALGPGLINRNRVIETMIRGKYLRHAIDEESKKKNIPRDKAERLAKEYISEIAAEVTPQIIAGFAILLKRLWNKIYDGIQVENAQRLKQMPANAEIVYVPCHRSHMDYLLLNYVLYDLGEVTPHVAAGVNLNFWPVGSLLRRFGAFYIRRTFNNNRLYSTVFSEYVAFLLQRGAPLQFFLEGGRSRSGKLLPPKTGMVAMVVNSYLRDPSRPIFFVPVYIGYDRVMEIKSYRKELSGSKKQSESVGQLVKTRAVLKSKHGKAYIGFGRPISLEDFLGAKHPSWQEHRVDVDAKPAWLNPVVQDLANDVMVEINENAIVGPVGLVAVILNASRTKAMAETELIRHIEKFMELAQKFPYSANVKTVNLTSKELVEYAEVYGKLNRFQHPGGDVLHLQEPNASFSLYARNNIAHIYALPSLIAYFLQHNDHISEDFLIEGTALVYPIVRQEFFLRWNQSQIRDIVRETVAAMLSCGLFIKRDDGTLIRPDVTTNEFTELRTLGLIVGAAIERYAVAVNLLFQYQDGSMFHSEEFQKKCVLMAQRISLLNGATDSELPSPGLFKIILEHLCEQNFLQKREGGFVLAPNFKAIYDVTSMLLSIDIRHSMMRARG
ncbi:MAG: glycerol-3-phosphate 1-O-acyltransferase PlsB [Proteobacteria bacterium]|nr:glycerol-3-phosphate 1-O-acyltransferase PlsB [Pseudomonadota bacterium]